MKNEHSEKEDFFVLIDNIHDGWDDETNLKLSALGTDCAWIQSHVSPESMPARIHKKDVPKLIAALKAWAKT